MPQKYPQQFRDRAIRMVTDRLEHDDAPSRYAVTQEISQKLGIAAETLRRWLKTAEQASGNAAAGAGDATAEIRRLKRENAELKRANEILKTASAFFRSGTRPPHHEMIAFIDMYRDRFGVEPICRVLSATECGFITSRGYRAAKTRPASDRSIRDELLIPVDGAHWFSSVPLAEIPQAAYTD